MIAKLKKLVEKAKRDRNVLAVVLFGSYARGEAHRDIDVCLVLRRFEPAKAARLRLAYVSEFGNGLDIHVFQLLPLYIRVRVFKEGKILHVKDEGALYDVAIVTAKAYEDFKPIYKGYLEAVAHG